MSMGAPLQMVTAKKNGEAEDLLNSFDGYKGGGSVNCFLEASE